MIPSQGFLIDASIWWYQAWFKQRQNIKEGIENPSNLELENFCKNLYEKFTYFFTRFGGSHSEFYIGLDSKEWRTPYFDEYVENNYGFFRCKAVKQWVVETGSTSYLIKWSKENNDWKRSSPSKAILGDLNHLDAEKWVKFTKTGAEKVFAEFPDVYNLVKYKGGRRSSWEKDYITPYEDFKKYAEILTIKLAAVFGAKVVKAPWAEFDDISHVWNTSRSGCTNVIITSDMDMDQELLRGTFTKIFDCGKMQWVEKTREVEELHFLAKMTGGDTSDNLNPISVMWKGKEKKIGACKWEHRDSDEPKMVDGKPQSVAAINWNKQILAENGGLQGAHKWLMENQLYNSYTKNYVMMNLGAMPKGVRDNITRALGVAVEKPKDEWTMEYFSIDPQELVDTIENAKADRRNDLRKGYFESHEEDEA